MGLFERYLTVWVGPCIVAGVALGNIAPGVFQAIAALEYAHVNLVVAVFIWVMIFPMMVQIDFAIDVPWGTLLLSVVLYVVFPLMVGLRSRVR